MCLMSFYYAICLVSFQLEYIMFDKTDVMSVPLCVYIHKIGIQYIYIIVKSYKLLFYNNKFCFLHRKFNLFAKSLLFQENNTMNVTFELMFSFKFVTKHKNKEM